MPTILRINGFSFFSFIVMKMMNLRMFISKKAMLMEKFG